MNNYRLYIIGGTDLMEDTHKDVWCIDMEEIIKILNGEIPENKNLWQRIETKGDIPGKLSNHSGVSIEDLIYVYAGLINNESCKNALYILDTTNYTWKQHITKVSLIIL